MGIGEHIGKRFDGDVEVTRLSMLTQPARIAALCESLPLQDREGIVRAIEAVVQPRIVQRQCPRATTFRWAVLDEGLDLIRTEWTDHGVEVMTKQSLYAHTSPFDVTSTQEAALVVAWLVLQRLVEVAPSSHRLG